MEAPMRTMRGGAVVVVALVVASCGKPRATLEVERQVTIVSPPPRGVVMPPASETTAPVGDVTTPPPTTVPAPPARRSSWVRGEKR